jgi:hypothetical protein
VREKIEIYSSEFSNIQEYAQMKHKLRNLFVMAAGGAHHLGSQGGGLTVLLRVLVLHGNSGSHQHLPEVGGEPHTLEVEEEVSVDIVLRGSVEGQVSQAEGVHHVCLVDSGAQLGRAAQPTGQWP